MKALVCGLIVASALPAWGKDRTPADKLVPMMLARLAKAADCAGKGQKKRVWCVAVDKWDKGTVADLPTAPLVGVSFGVRADLPVEDLLAGEATLAVFAVKKDADKPPLGVITDLRPENAAEKRIIGDGMAAVAKTIKGDEPAAKLDPALHKLVQAVSGAATHPVVKGDTAWQMTGQSDTFVRRAGDVWIAVEVPKEGPEGIFVSIFTDRYSAK
jgi:hypothetical protein